MTELLQVRTPHADVADVVSELSFVVNDSSLRLKSPTPIADGEWVRFSVELSNGTSVWEGVGRCEGCVQTGKHFQVQLGLLSFDGLHEIMFERILLAADAAEPKTDTIDISSLEREALSRPARPTSLPPPPPGASRSGAAAKSSSGKLPRPSRAHRADKSATLPPPSPPGRRDTKVPPPARLPAGKPSLGGDVPSVEARRTKIDNPPGPTLASARPSERPRSAPTPPAAKPAAAKPAAAKPAAAKPAAAKPSPAKKAATKQAPAKKASAKKTATKQAPTKKTAARAGTGTSTKKATTKAASGKKTPTKKSGSKSVASKRAESPQAAPAKTGRRPKLVDANETVQGGPKHEAPSMDTVVTTPDTLHSIFGQAQKKPPHLELTQSMLSQAQDIATDLPDLFVNVGNEPDARSRAVLRTALRLGLASLKALANEEKA